MQAFTPIKDLNMASVIATLVGVAKIEAITDVRTGNGDSSVSFPTSIIPKILAPVKGSNAKRKASIMELIRNGTLAEIDPYHNALDAVRALINRERILDWIKQGKQQRLVEVGNSQRFIYSETDALPVDVTKYPRQWETRDIKLAAAMASIGVPICRIVGNGNGRVFYLAADAIALPAELRFDAYSLARRYFAGDIPEHPIAWGVQALKNRERILDMIHGKDPQLYIRKLASQRGACAVITPTEDKKFLAKQFNAAKKHCGSF